MNRWTWLRRAVLALIAGVVLGALAAHAQHRAGWTVELARYVVPGTTNSPASPSTGTSTSGKSSSSPVNAVRDPGSTNRPTAKPIPVDPAVIHQFTATVDTYVKSHIDTTPLTKIDTSSGKPSKPRKSDLPGGGSVPGGIGFPGLPMVSVSGVTITGEEKQPPVDTPERPWLGTDENLNLTIDKGSGKQSTEQRTGANMVTLKPSVAVRGRQEGRPPVSIVTPPAPPTSATGLSTVRTSGGKAVPPGPSVSVTTVRGKDKGRQSPPVAAEGAIAVQATGDKGGSNGEKGDATGQDEARGRKAVVAENGCSQSDIIKSGLAQGVGAYLAQQYDQVMNTAAAKTGVDPRDTAGYQSAQQWGAIGQGAQLYDEFTGGGDGSDACGGGGKRPSAGDITRAAHDAGTPADPKGGDPALPPPPAVSGGSGGGSGGTAVAKWRLGSLFHNYRAYDFTTPPDTTVFYSGETAGTSAIPVADGWASARGLTTIDKFMADNGIPRPGPGTPMWRLLSRLFAGGASGTVYAVLGDDIAKDSVWLQDEFPALRRNAKVTQIIRIDPKTGLESSYWP